jgi:hypothetical protein
MTTTDTEQAALTLAYQLHLQQGSMPRAGVERYLARTSPNLEPSQVLDHAVAQDWLKDLRRRAPSQSRSRPPAMTYTTPIERETNMTDTTTETDNISKARQYLQDAEQSESSALLGIGWALVSIAESLDRAHPVWDKEARRCLSSSVCRVPRPP